MTDNNKKTEVKFAPGVLEDLETEMSHEELQQFLDALAELASTGALNEYFDEAEPVDMEQLRREDPELYETLNKQLDGCYDENGEPPVVH